MNPDGSNIRLVYPSSHGSICPECAKPIPNCVCREIKRSAVPRASGVARISYDTKGRKGKGVTLISGLPLSESGLLNLARKLKQRFGAGGSVKGYVIELQGDHRKQAAQELCKLGFHAQPT